MNQCATRLLPFHIVDADYWERRHEVVMLVTEPDALVLMDPDTLLFDSIPLPAPGASLSLLSSRAAVSHDQAVSIVDIEAKQLEATIATTASAGDVVLGDDFAYVFPASGESTDVFSIGISTRADYGAHDGPSHAGTLGKLAPNAIYAIDAAERPTALRRYGLQGVAIQAVSASAGDHPACGDLFFGTDSTRVFTGCGSIFRTTLGEADDMTYEGMLGGVPPTGVASGVLRYRSMYENSEYLVAVPAAEPSLEREPGPELLPSIDIFDAATLIHRWSTELPCMDVEGTAVTAYGKFVFVPERFAYVLVRADGSSAPNAWGIAGIPLW